MTTPTTVQTIHGKHITVRIDGYNQFSDGSFWRYKVAYLYSKTKNQWRYVEKRDGDFLHYDIENARAFARRVVKRNGG